jgi:uncharacterized protein YndB with AHSA1/START domain
MSNDIKDREVVLQRTLPFARELVWKAITEKEHASRWWGPDGFKIEGMALDLKVGGVWSFDMVVEKYGAIEGGKQHLAKMEAYIKENLA